MPAACDKKEYGLTGEKEMRLFICGSYADASDRAVFPAATNKIKKLAEILEREISERKTAVEYIVRGQEEQKRFLIEGSNQSVKDYKRVNEEVIELEKIKEDITIKVNKLENTKENLFIYTIEIVSIVVAILAIVLTISYLSLNNYNPQNVNDILWIPTSALLYFCIMFSIFVIFWAWVKLKDRTKIKNIEKFGGEYMIERDPRVYGLMLLSWSIILLVAGAIGIFIIKFDPGNLGLAIFGSFIASILIILYDFWIVKGGTRQENYFLGRIQDIVDTSLRAKFEEQRRLDKDNNKSEKEIK